MFVYFLPILEARVEILQKFGLLFGQWSFKKNCFWDFLTFNKRQINWVIWSYFCRILRIYELYFREQWDLSVQWQIIFVALVTDLGGFQLEFVSISRVINHMTCYKFKCSHWLKLQHSDWRANLVTDFFKNKFSTNESTRIHNRSCDL